MSYNESLRSDSNYPPMSQADWDRAPWNQEDIPEKDFDIVISQSLSKLTDVSTNEYLIGEDGKVSTDDVCWSKAYQESHYTILDLIETLKTMCEEMVEKSDYNTFYWTSETWCRNIIKECEGWQEDESIIEEA